MDKTFNQLELMGYKVTPYLIGISQFLSKETIIIKHESMKKELFEDATEPETIQTLSDGTTLYTEKPSFWHHNFISDVVVEEGNKYRVWRSTEYDATLQEWALSVDDKTPTYSEYSIYYKNMDDFIFADFIDKIYAKAESYVESPTLLPRFMGLMIHTQYQYPDLMAEIVTDYSKEQVDKFLEVVKKCTQLSLPITDYREVFNFSQSNS